MVLSGGVANCSMPSSGTRAAFFPASRLRHTPPCKPPPTSSLFPTGQRLTLLAQLTPAPVRHPPCPACPHSPASRGSGLPLHRIVLRCAHPCPVPLLLWWLAARGSDTPHSPVARGSRIRPTLPMHPSPATDDRQIWPPPSWQCPPLFGQR